MLNLNKLQPQINSMVASLVAHYADEVTPYERQAGTLNPQRVMARKQNVSASLSDMAPLYRQLKDLGWTSTQSIHPVDRVAVLQRAAALLRRDPDFSPGWWVVELAGVEHALAGSPLALTAEVDRLMMGLAAAPVVTEPEPEPEIKALSLAAEIALGLKSEYPELTSRIDSALAAVEAGLQPSYKTEWDNAGRYGTWSCNCPDAVFNRPPRTRFGVGCKHALAGVIRQQMDQRQADIRNREVEKNQERQQQRDRQQRETALPASVTNTGSIDDFLGNPRLSAGDIIRQIEQENAARYARENARYATALRPDPANLAGRPNVTLKGIGHL